MVGMKNDWVEEALRDCRRDIELGLDHSLHNAPGRVNVAKRALDRLENIVKRLQAGTVLMGDCNNNAIEVDAIDLPVRLWVDDVRQPVMGWWCCAKSVAEALDVLMHRNVVEVSLDHDLGDYGYLPKELLPIGAQSQAEKRELTGMTILEWMAATNTWPDRVWVHTDNACARKDMVDFIEKNYKRHRRVVHAYNVHLISEMNELTDADIGKVVFEISTENYYVITQVNPPKFTVIPNYGRQT